MGSSLGTIDCVPTEGSSRRRGGPVGVHLQFGVDASTTMLLSWAAVLGRAGAVTSRATAWVYRDDGQSMSLPIRSSLDCTGEGLVLFRHATAARLQPATAYRYTIREGSHRFDGSFVTAPRGRRPFRFTACGDIGVPPSARGVRDPETSTFAGLLPDAIDAQKPLFHAALGDLAYANLSAHPVDTWQRFFANIERSAARRPWMPCAGNHENEPDSGFRRFQQRFALPANGSARHRGLWYAFQVASVRFIALNGDDVCHQRGSQHDVLGYSEGEQRQWLTGQLQAAHRDPTVDWIIVLVHQAFVSSVGQNGADVGLRAAFGELFDRFGVDLVLSGHEHSYERSHPLRAARDGSALHTPSSPLAGGPAASLIDTTMGTTHVIIGGGGAAPSQHAGGAPAEAGRVIVRRDDGGVERRSEPAHWSACRGRPDLPFGYACIDVDPGVPAGQTTLSVCVLGHSGRAGAPFVGQDAFVLWRDRGRRQATVRAAVA